MPDESVSVGESVDAVVLVRQVLAEESPVRAVAEVRPHVQVMLGSPDLRAGAAGQRRVDRPEGRARGPTWRRARSRAARRSRRTRSDSMEQPNWPCQLSRSSSNRPPTLANGCIISRRPTRPDAFASPSGCAGDADSSSSRGVPIAFAARTTTAAPARSARRPSRSSQVAPVTSPAAFVSSRRTRAPVTSRAPARSPWASGSGRSTPWRPRCSPAGTSRAGRTDGGRRRRPTGSSWAPATSASPAGCAPARP